VIYHEASTVTVPYQDASQLATPKCAQMLHDNLAYL